jgi:hypothetical protein
LVLFFMLRAVARCPRKERSSMTVRTTAVAAVAAVSLSLVACQRTSTDNAPVTTTTPGGQSTAPAAAAAKERDNALVRVVHAVPAGSTVDVYADDQRVFNAVDYQTVTPYREVAGERASIEVRPAGAPQGEPVASNTEGLDDGEHYTVFAVPGNDAKASLRVVKDDHSLPASGKARLRVVHASTDAGEIDVYAPGREAPLVDGVNFQSVSAYTHVDPVAGPLMVRREGERNAVVSVPDVKLDAGKTYTLVVAGSLKATPKVDAFVIEDMATAMPAPAPSTP